MRIEEINMDNDIKKMLGEILTSVKGLEERVARIEESPSRVSTSSPEVSAPSKRISLKEFLIECAPTNGVQTTLAVAYYIEKYDGATPFNAADLEKGFRAAKEPVPTNINDKANMCIKNGHLMEAEGKKDNMKAWVVTRSGEQVVEKGFAKEK